MIHTSVTNFRKNLFHMLEQAIKYNEPIHINTKAGNAVVLSEDEYNSFVETLYLSSNPNMRKKIIEGMNTLTEDCVPESEVKW